MTTQIFYYTGAVFYVLIGIMLALFVILLIRKHLLIFIRSRIDMVWAGIHNSYYAQRRLDRAIKNLLTLARELKDEGVEEEIIEFVVNQRVELSEARSHLLKTRRMIFRTKSKKDLIERWREENGKS